MASLVAIAAEVEGGEVDADLLAMVDVGEGEATTLSIQTGTAVMAGMRLPGLHRRWMQRHRTATCMLITGIINQRFKACLLEPMSTRTSSP